MPDEDDEQPADTEDGGLFAADIHYLLSTAFCSSDRDFVINTAPSALR